jgi:hypothetical protein
MIGRYFFDARLKISFSTPVKVSRPTMKMIPIIQAIIFISRVLSDQMEGGDQPLPDDLGGQTKFK